MLVSRATAEKEPVSVTRMKLRSAWRRSMISCFHAQMLCSLTRLSGAEQKVIWQPESGGRGHDLTILTALGGLITALIAGALVAPTQETAARAVGRAAWSGHAMP